MRKFIVGAALGIALALAVPAVASVPDANGVIHACVKNGSGALRVIDTEPRTVNGRKVVQACASDETPLNWRR